MKVYERDPAKRPAAVVLLTRGPLVLAITCKGRIADLQLIGGKMEPIDGELHHTARRELCEETCIVADVVLMRPLVKYVAHTGRPVQAFTVEPQPGREWPATFAPTAAGWPGWVHPEALLTRWCTYREECETILIAHARMLGSTAPRVAIQRGAG